MGRFFVFAMQIGTSDRRWVASRALEIIYMQFMPKIQGRGGISG